MLYPGLRSVCIREIQKSLEQSVKRLIEDKIRKYGLGRHFDIRATEIRTPGDGIIIFQGMQNHTADSVKSLEGYHRAWAEEAQNLSQRSLDLLRPTIRSPGSQIWASWNPNLPTDPIEGLLRGKDRVENSIVVEANWWNNPLFPDVLKEDKDYDKRRDRDKYDHIWCGGYQKNSEARVFRNWSVDEFEAPEDAIFWLGADWGYSIDPTVLVRCFVGRWDGMNAVYDPTGNCLFIDHCLYAHNVEVEEIPEFFDGLVPDEPEWARDWPIIADSASPQTISYVSRNGYKKLRGSIKGAGSIKEGVKFLQSFDIVVHPRCKAVSDELQHFSHKTDPLTNAVVPVLKDADNHVIDALRYAAEEARTVRRTTQTGSY